MENVKKTLIVFWAVVIAILMVSVASAVPQVQSEPVMDKLEQIEKADNLKVDQETLNKIISGDLNEADLQAIANNLDLNGFVNYFTSTKFANFFKSANVQNFLNSQEYNNFYNSDAVVTIRNSEQFTNFLNSDIAQQFLVNINGGGGNSNPQSQGVTSTVSQINSVVGQKVAITSNNVAVNQNVVCVGAQGVMAIRGQSVQINTQANNAFNVLAGLFILFICYIIVWCALYLAVLIIYIIYLISTPGSGLFL
jgi:hypothetical protein